MSLSIASKATPTSNGKFVAESPSIRGSKDEYYAIRRKYLQLETEMKRIIALNAIDRAELENKLKLAQDELDTARHHLNDPITSEAYLKLRAHYHSAVEKLLIENKAASEQLHTLQNEVKHVRSLEQKNKHLLQVKAELESTSDKTAQEKVILQQELKGLAVRIKELQDNNAALRSDSEEALSSLEAGMAAEKEKVRSLEKEKDSLRKQLEGSQAHNKKLASQVHQMMKAKALRATEADYDDDGSIASSAYGTGSILASRSGYVVNSVAGSRSLSNATGSSEPRIPSPRVHGKLDGYESDNDTVRRGLPDGKAPAILDYDSDDSLETEINRLLPERVEYVRNFGRNIAASTQADSESSACWDVDNERKILPILRTFSAISIAPENSGGNELSFDMVTPEPKKESNITTEKDPWLQKKLDEIFGAVEIKYDSQVLNQFVEGPSSDATPTKKSVYKEPPLEDSRFVRTELFEGDMEELIVESEDESEDESVLEKPIVHVQRYNPRDGIPKELSEDDDAGRHLELMKEVKSVAASSSVSRANTIIPFSQGTLPFNFEYIRAITLSEIPDDVESVEGIFQQLTAGAVERITFNRKTRKISIVFVESLAAREQYIKFYNKGLYVPRGNSHQCSKDPHDHYHTIKPDPFEYGPDSEPLPAALVQAIYNGITRVLTLKGNPKKLSAKKIKEDIMTRIPGVPKNPADVFEAVVFAESEEILIRFTAITYAARAFKVINASPEYKDIFVGYGPDPCDQERFYPTKVEKKDAAGELPKKVIESTALLSAQPDPVPATQDENAPAQGIQQKRSLLPEAKNTQTQPNSEIKPVRIHIKGYTQTGTHNVDNMNQDEVNFMLAQFAERGLVSEKVLRQRGMLPTGRSKWDQDGNEIISAGSNIGPPHVPTSNWAANEQNAIKAYRASLHPEDGIAPRDPPGIPSSETTYAREHYSSRMVYITGIPLNISYDRFCMYVKGGALDTIKLNPEEGTAIIIFLRAKDASSYKRYLTANEVSIDGHRIMPQNPSQTRLTNMRLWDPEKVIREGISRCIFIEGLPNSTTDVSLKLDLASLNPAVKLEYENITVDGVCARVWLPSISMANFIERNLGAHPKYTGIRIRYEEDFCAGHLALIGKTYR